MSEPDESSKNLEPWTLTVDRSPDGTKPMSKNAIKKAAKAERLAALKLERRAREKEAKKERKRIGAEKRAAGELDDVEEGETKRRLKKPKLQFGGIVVIDLGFDNMMNDKEIVSLCSQLAYTYSANRQASFPFSLIYTSLNGRTFDRLEDLGDASYKRWTNTKWWSEGYSRLWENGDDILQPDTEIDLVRVGSSSTNGEKEDSAFTSSAATQTLPNTTQNNIPKSTVIYLTADSEDELFELKPDETYIIGGICDHNRYKNLCLNKARDSGIRTARLPIGRYLASLPTRKVLTVNQVFEILVKWVETKDWEQSLYSVIPKRKFQQEGKGVLEANMDAADAESESVQQEHDSSGLVIEDTQ
ncbi:hypothetical protein BYT27DRAFT_7191602 [Phlegmacium glaucopus]|nr:hypothetical protein BYT27DRAFT_7191602 [Phlegmacium glaucopus]